MDADLDLLCISVYCTADDLLPERPRNARRKLSDAEVVTLSVAQVLMGIPSDRRFLRAARRQLGHLFPHLPSQDAFHKRRARLAETIEWLTGIFASQSPGCSDDLVLLDSTPVECGRSLETARRSQLADVCGYGYSKSHSRWFWGCRLHLACAPDGTPKQSPTWERSCSGRQERPSRRPASTSPRSGNGSSPSSGPAKTCSPSNATAPAHHTTCSHGSRPDCSHSPPASASTTNSADPAEQSPTTPPNHVASTV
jgi:hypothetical protein